MATLVTYIPLLILGFVFLGDAFTKLVTGPKFETEDPAVMFPAMAEMMEQMAPFTVVAMLVYVPFMWFTSLLLGIAFQKFRAKEGVDVKRQRL